MIEKEIICDFPGDPSPTIQLLDSAFMEKTAEYSPELQEAIDRIEKKVDYIYLLINALSAGEAFGPNRNGDYFPEKELINHHKTYETMGFQYRHHENKDPKKSYGKVIFAHYNPRMRRVEIIVELPVQKNLDIIKRLKYGETVSTSMGTRVPYDICSICGNKAKTRKQYCSHLLMKMGRVLEDGRRVYAINVEPKFFDSSFVTRPAEPTAGVLMKVASLDEDKRAEDKEAVIKKEIPGEIKAMDKDPKNLIIGSQIDIPEKVLKKLSADYSNEELVSTLVALRVCPKSSEFNKLGIDYVSVPDEGKVNMKIAGDLGNLLSNLVLTKPLVLTRLNKNAQCINADATDIYKDFVNTFNASKSTKFLNKAATLNDSVVNIWTGADLGVLELQSTLMKQAEKLNNIFINIPDSYLASGKLEVGHPNQKLEKTAEGLSSCGLFLDLSSKSLNDFYNSLLDMEECI